MVQWPVKTIKYSGDMNVTESMVNSTTSASNSVLRYDVDKGQNFVPECNIYPSLISQIKNSQINQDISPAMVAWSVKASTFSFSRI